MNVFLQRVGYGTLFFFGSVLLFVAISVLYQVSNRIGEYIAIAFMVLPALALIRPMPMLKLGHRGFSFALFMLVGLPATSLTQQYTIDRREAQFSELKATDLDAYLVALKEFDQNRWLLELKSIDPEQHAVEVARLAEAARLRREAARLEAEAELAETKEIECGEKNEGVAYVMSQEFVARQLLAPSTAEFPGWPSEYNVRAIGDCQFEVVSYVDAQNAFGAMIRSRYSATMLLYPVEGSWAAIELNIAE